MLYYALVFLILGLVASLFGAYGVAAVASQIAWVLFVIGIVLIIAIVTVFMVIQGRQQHAAQVEQYRADSTAAASLSVM